ncbi:MAG: hypothetical protein QOJ59_447, partial [Thermomicrobiales bacterium]|nr:hypothetical protein [Thermomicrobiales bacterium]
MKGVGSLGPEAAQVPEPPNPSGKWVHENHGSVSVIPFADLTAEKLPEHTAAVYANNQWSTSRCSSLERPGTVDGGSPKPVPVPVRIGDPSSIKHVFYIIKKVVKRGLSAPPNVAKYVTPYQGAKLLDRQARRYLNMSGR